jgi:hypothetical protein
MTERTFGGHTLVDLKKFRRHPADGANFYLAFLEAAPEMFQLAEEFETLESFVFSLVEKIDKAADPSTGDDQRVKILDDLKQTLDDSGIRKIIASQ